MNIRIAIKDMKDAEKFSATCQKFPVEFYLRAGNFCVDPKSALGVLAIMYSDRDNMYVDTNEMDDDMMPKFLKSIETYISK